MKAERFMQYVDEVANKDIVLLRNKQVVQWLYGDLSFLSTSTNAEEDVCTENKKKERLSKARERRDWKILEDKWGQDVLRGRRPDLKLDKQWTNKFGEHLCEELYQLLGRTVCKPMKKEHFQPDLEADDVIIESKAGTYFTDGTAGEKILGCPFKYADIPALYNKPLKIICLGGAEKMCRESYGNLPGDKCTASKQQFIDFFRHNQIEFVGATDILNALSDAKAATNT